MSSTSSQSWKPKYFDIGVNFSDQMFQGCYNGSNTPKHPADIDEVISRAHTFNVNKMLITASSIQESEDHFKLVDRYPNFFASTVGVHPCTVAQEFYTKYEGSNEFTEDLIPDLETKLSKLRELTTFGFKNGHVKAFGEIGLDYDRLNYSTKNQQLTMFKKQLEVLSSIKHLKIPLFLHMRNACDDFVSIIKPFIENGDIEKGNGVVHSFTGTKEELEKILNLGFYIGINGCSLRSQENLEVASMIPKEKLMIETDAPWCEIRKSHESYKFITKYPSKFYPEIIKPTEEVEVDITPQAEAIQNEDNKQEPLNQKQKPKKKQQAKPKQPAIKFDDFLPYPSIKKENFEKHRTTVEILKKDKSLQQESFDLIGELSYPLIKSRNEPVFVGYIAEIMSKLYKIEETQDIEDFIDLIYENSCKLFKF